MRPVCGLTSISSGGGKSQPREGTCALDERGWGTLRENLEGWFSGSKLHCLRSISGRFLNVVLTPGSVDDRDPASDGVVTLGDLSCRGVTSAELLEQEAEVLPGPRADVPARKFLLSQVGC